MPAARSRPPPSLPRRLLLPRNRGRAWSQRNQRGHEIEQIERTASPKTNRHRPANMTTTTLDDLKIAWNELSQKLERQNSLALHQFRENKLARFRSGLRPLVL